MIDISEAFYNCRYVSELIIPEGVEKVGGFAGSDNLHAITLPASVNDFHGGAGSSNLERVDVVEDNQKYTSIDGVVFLRPVIG